MGGGKNLRVAIVHDWLVAYRGGERVLEAICEMFPDAPIYTLFCDPKSLPKSLQDKDIRYPKFLSSFNFLRKLLLPILPTLAESIDLTSYDLVISTSSCVAKGVIPAPTAQHICYLHSPMRYIWDQKSEYLGKLLRFWPLAIIIESLLKNLRLWDVTSSTRVDKFVVNSNFVGARVRRFYGRSFEVIAPPVDLDFYQVKASKEPGQYLIAVGAFVPYKRFDLVIQACERLNQKLIIVGNGPLLEKLQALAKGNTTFVIDPPKERLRELLSGAKAMLFPQVEDFGIVAIEALSCGTPLIALSQGGALDYVEDGVNGVFFAEQNVESLTAALQRFNSQTFDRQVVSQSAAKFSKKAFMEKFANQITQMMGPL